MRNAERYRWLRRLCGLCRRRSTEVCQLELWVKRAGDVVERGVLTNFEAQ